MGTGGRCRDSYGPNPPGGNPTLGVILPEVKERRREGGGGTVRQRRSQSVSGPVSRGMRGHESGRYSECPVHGDGLLRSKLHPAPTTTATARGGRIQCEKLRCYSYADICWSCQAHFSSYPIREHPDPCTAGCLTYCLSSRRTAHVNVLPHL